MKGIQLATHDSVHVRMRISGYGSAAHAPAASAPQKPPAPVRSEPKLEPSDGFASTQLPPGVGESLNIVA